MFISFRIFAFLGLFFIFVGTGGVKPCIFAFGGDQFQLPQQEKQIQHFATMFTLAIYTGSLISTFLMPELRYNIHCFGRDTCFPLAFGVLTIMMLTATGIYIVETKLIFITVITHYSQSHGAHIKYIHFPTI